MTTDHAGGAVAAITRLRGCSRPSSGASPRWIAQLKTVAEDTKIALSTTDAIAVDRFLRTPGGGARPSHRRHSNRAEVLSRRLAT